MAAPPAPGAPRSAPLSACDTDCIPLEASVRPGRRAAAGRCARRIARPCPLPSQAATGFDNQPYVVTTTLPSPTSLHVLVERRQDGAAWAARLDAADVAALTARGGSPKPLPGFVKMLRSAAAGEGGRALRLDLLSPADVAAAGRAPPPPAPALPSGAPPRPAAPPDDRRYLILTYASEYERAVYPLPRAPEADGAAARRLRALVSSLRDALDAAAADRGVADLARARDEAAALRAALAASEGAADEACAALAARAAAAEAELDAERAACRRAVRGARAERDAALQAATAARGAAAGDAARARAAAAALDCARARSGPPLTPPRFDPTAYVRERAAKGARRPLAAAAQPAATPAAATPPASKPAASPTTPASSTPPPAPPGHLSAIARGPSLPPRPASATTAGADLDARLDTLRGFLESARAKRAPTG